MTARRSHIPCGNWPGGAEIPGGRLAAHRPTVFFGPISPAGPRYAGCTRFRRDDCVPLAGGRNRSGARRRAGARLGLQGSMCPVDTGRVGMPSGRTSHDLPGRWYDDLHGGRRSGDTAAWRGAPSGQGGAGRWVCRSSDRRRSLRVRCPIRSGPPQPLSPCRSPTTHDGPSHLRPQRLLLYPTRAGCAGRLSVRCRRKVGSS